MGCGRSSLFGLTTDEKLDCAVHVEKKLQKTLNALGVPVADVQEMYVFSPVASYPPAQRRRRRCLKQPAYSDPLYSNTSHRAYPHCTTPPPPLSFATRI
jgi:hypothetical protein